MNSIKQYLKHKTVSGALVSLAAAALLCTSCSKDEEVTLRVMAENYQGHAKTYVGDDLVTYWSDGDQVVINGTAKEVQIATTGSQSTCYIYNVQSASNYWSVYPASITSTSTSFGSDGSITGLTLPATQSYTVVDGRQVVPTVMAAYLNTPTGTINYYNACIALQITLQNTYSRDLQLSKVTVRDNDAPLCGPFNMTGVRTGNPSLVYAGGATVPDEHKQVELSFGTDRLTLVPTAAVTVYVILPPTDSYTDNKFTIEVAAMDGDHDGETVYEFSHTQSSAASGAIGRNWLAPISVELNDPHTLVLKGKGVEGNPYRISTVDDFVSMQNLVDKGYEPIGGGAPFASAYYVLKYSISLTNNAPIVIPPIGTARNNFTGTFDGQGNTLYNLSLTGGLFGHLGPGATVRNLNVQNATVDMQDATAGGVFCAHANRATIDHCQVTGTVDFLNMPASRAAYVGGIVGEAIAFDQSHSTIFNCHCGARVVAANSSALHRVGGIVGHLQNSTVFNSYTMLFDGARPDANSHTIWANEAYAGGIVGRMDGDSYVVNCYFGVYDDFYNETSGLTGDICGELTSNAHIVRCYHRGRVYAKGTPDPDYLAGNYPYTNDRFSLSNGSLGSKLNEYVSQMSGLGLLSWTVPNQTYRAPYLSY